MNKRQLRKEILTRKTKLFSEGALLMYNANNEFYNVALMNAGRCVAITNELLRLRIELENLSKEARK